MQRTRLASAAARSAASGTEFVDGLARQGAPLRETQVGRLAGRATARETRRAGDEAQVLGPVVAARRGPVVAARLGRFSALLPTRKPVWFCMAGGIVFGGATSTTAAGRGSSVRRRVGTAPPAGSGPSGVHPPPIELTIRKLGLPFPKSGRPFEGAESGGAVVMIHNAAAASAAVLLLVAHSGLRAEPVEDFYRGKTVHALVGVSAGGEYDIQLRLVARHIGKYLPGRPNVVAENMLGATGMVMANHLYRVAPKDGTTIGLIQNGLPTAQAVGLPGVQFDSARYNWLGSLAPTVETIAVWKSTGVTTLDGARNTEITAGAIGASGITLTFPRLLNDLLHTQFKVVTGYPGAGAVNLAMERGEVAARNTSWTSWKAAKPDWIAAKDISILVYSGPTPADLKGVPRLEDLVAGEDREVVDIVTAGSRLGHPFATAPGVPAERVDALRLAFREMSDDAEFRKEAAASQIDIDLILPAELQAGVAAALNASDAAKQRARKYFD
jgi:tripartite-type tricarboxylate transporter receptor subunit TctC